MFLRYLTILLLSGSIIGCSGRFQLFSDNISISPVSIAAGGVNFRISEEKLRDLSVELNQPTAMLAMLGIVEGEYSRAQLVQKIAQLDTEFETLYLDYYQNVILPVSDVAEQNPQAAVYLEGAVSRRFEKEIDDFLLAYGQDFAAQFRSSKNNFKQDSKGYSDYIYSLDTLRKRASSIRRVKLQLRDWLQHEMENYKFERSLRLTVDIANEEGKPLLTSKLAYVDIFMHKLNSRDLPMLEYAKQCRSQVVCRIEFVHILAPESRLDIIVDAFRDQIPSQELLDILKLELDPQRQPIRQVVDAITIDLKMLVNGDPKRETLEGKFLVTLPWERSSLKF